MRRVCRALALSRSSLYNSTQARAKKAPDTLLSERIYLLINQHPTYGYRRVWALLRYREGQLVNRKKIYRLMKIKGWMLHQRQVTPKPRVRKLRSQAEERNQRWAMDLTHIYCGADGWGHLAAVIDCHDREIVGYEFALRGRAKEAESALEQACLRRFGTLRPTGRTQVIRSDNGLIFQSRRFREACRFYQMKQEYITPYTPEQNGMIERFFRSLKEECVWQHNFGSFRQASEKVREWIRWYNELRPHQALGYSSPVQFRQKRLLVA